MNKNKIQDYITIDPGTGEQKLETNFVIKFFMINLLLPTMKIIRKIKILLFIKLIHYRIVLFYRFLISP